MSNTLKTTFAAIIIAAVVAFGVSSANKTAVPANVLTDVGSVASGHSFGATATGLSSVLFSHLTNLLVNQNMGTVQTFFMGSDPTIATNASPLQTNVSVGSSAAIPISCNTASSTLFAIQPPAGATSTVTFMNLSGSVTRTTDIIVGTSTLPGGMIATSTLAVTGGGGLFGAGSVPAGQVYTVAGLKLGPKTGYTVNGNGVYTSVGSIVVGPNEYLVGYATSTAATGGNSMASCNYKIEWQN